MRFYERQYVGDEAKKRRYCIVQAVREGKKTGYWILTLPSNGKNLLDLYPAMALAQPYYKEKDMLILGIAAYHDDAVRLSARIVNQVYQKTGGFDVAGFLLGNLKE